MDNDFLRGEIPLWAGAAPGSEDLKLSQQIIERSTDPNVKDRAIVGICAPSLIPFFPDAAKADGSAVIIAPGGAYERVCYDKEGEGVAQWLNSLGAAAFVLKYRLPAEGQRLGYQVPLQDIQRAVRLVKHHAAAWNIDTARVGVMGFSAGGHLSATLGTRHSSQTYDPVDSADGLDARPAFMVLGYPVINLGTREPKPNLEPLRAYPNERLVDAGTPPAFIFHAHDDKGVSSEHSVLFYTALKKAGVEADLHIFRRGGHGFGIRAANGPVRLWTKLCEEWLADMGFIDCRQGQYSQGDD